MQPKKQNSNSFIKDALKTVFSLTAICVVVAVILSGVNALTAEKIEYNLEQSINKLFVEMFGEGMTAIKLDSTPKGLEAIYEISVPGNKYYCANIVSIGFGGEINILAAFNADGTVKSVQVVSHSETPGIGTVIEDDGFLNRFLGKSNVAEVDTVSGATISSTALRSGIVNAKKILSDAGIIGAGQ